MQIKVETPKTPVAWFYWVFLGGGYFCCFYGCLFGFCLVGFFCEFVFFFSFFCWCGFCLLGVSYPAGKALLVGHDPFLVFPELP